MSRKTVLWEIESLPFYWGQQESPTNGPELPDTLPFTLCIDEDTGVLMQAHNEKVSAALEKAYAIGSSITGMMDDEGIGKDYAEDMLVFFNSHVSGLEKKKVLEVGCGSGYLLSRLKAMGAEVLGIEPGAHGQLGASKYRVPILQDYFPSPRVRGKFDVIVISNVLEHMEDPVAFMGKLTGHLVDGGQIVIAVPDEGPSVFCGDASMMFHEHWCYFTGESLTEFMRAVGGSELTVAKSGFGGVLYACMSWRAGVKEGGSPVSEQLRSQYAGYVEKVRAANDRLSRILDDADREGQAVAIYVPIRAINALHLLGAQDRPYRFVDDNGLLHGTYLPGFPSSVVGRDSLLQDPAAIVVIMSYSFGGKIRNNLLPVLAKSTRILTIADLMEADMA